MTPEEYGKKYDLPHSERKYYGYYDDGDPADGGSYDEDRFGEDSSYYNLVTWILTDPWYLIPDDKWDVMYNKYIKTNNNYKGFANAIAKELKKITGHTAFVSDTGCGPWHNTYRAQYDHPEQYIIYGRHPRDFDSVSGMVCLCRYITAFDSIIDSKVKDFRGHIALMDLSSNTPIYVKFDKTDPNWTVVMILENEQFICTAPEEDGDPHDLQDELFEVWDEEHDDDDDWTPLKEPGWKSE